MCPAAGLSPVAGLVPFDRPRLVEALVGAGLETCLMDGDPGGRPDPPHHRISDIPGNGLRGFAIEFPQALEREAQRG